MCSRRVSRREYLIAKVRRMARRLAVRLADHGTLCHGLGSIGASCWPSLERTLRRERRGIRAAEGRLARDLDHLASLLREPSTRVSWPLGLDQAPGWSFGGVLDREEGSCPTSGISTPSETTGPGSPGDGPSTTPARSAASPGGAAVPRSTAHATG